MLAKYPARRPRQRWRWTRQVPQIGVRIGALGPMPGARSYERERGLGTSPEQGQDDVVDEVVDKFLVERLAQREAPHEHLGRHDLVDQPGLVVGRQLTTRAGP